jgi:hypothetical protein
VALKGVYSKENPQKGLQKERVPINIEVDQNPTKKVTLR